MRTFVAVAQSLSFTRAGETLGLRQPTVSQHVRRLEDAVGRPLCVRDTRSVALTSDGEAPVEAPGADEQGGGAKAASA